MFIKNFIFLMQTDDNSGGGTVDTDSMSDDDILNADLEELGLEDETTESVPSEEESKEEESLSEDADTEDEEDTTESEKSEEEEEPEEEPIEALPEATFRGVKEKYPNFFKEFPDVAKSFGKVKQYEEAFATPEDAKEAFNVLGNFQEIANDLQTGNPVKLLTSLAESNPDAVVEFSRNILPVLSKLDEGLFYEAALPVLSHFLKNVVKAAQKSDDLKYGKNLETAARYISHWAFKDTNIPDFSPKRSNNQQDPERERFERERNEFLNGRFQETSEDINNQYRADLSKIISATLKNVQSLKGQNPYVINKIQSDIIKEINLQLGKDENFSRSQRSLWNRAARTNFRDKEVLSRIKSAALERSKPLISKIAKKVLLEAKLIKSNKPVVKKDMTPSGRVNRHSTNNVRNINPRSVDFQNTSDIDILNDNVKVRGAK